MKSKELKLIVGLGNPGREYKDTKHNLGFFVIDNFYKNLNSKSSIKEKFNGAFLKEKNFIIAKPFTYMNLSGNFVRKIADFFKINKKNILIIHDDMSFNFGKAVFKTTGGSAGHNGIKDIINALGTKEFSRIRIGIGSAIGKNTSDYVLSRLSKNEKEQIESLLPKIIKTIEIFIDENENEAALYLNSTK